MVRKYLLALLFPVLFYGKIVAQSPPNFIFIIVDDLNDYVNGFTDQPQIATPHLNQIAAEGTIFLNAYANAAGCAPSRTSFLTGKDLHYTQVYSNDDYNSVFRDNFTTEKNNSEIFTLPQILKDSGNYFTYSINKTFHSPNENDFDQSENDPCSKGLSWNRMSLNFDSETQLQKWEEFNFGNYFDWGQIPDNQETLMEDYIGADTAIEFIHQYAAGTVNTCDKPFFLALGFYKPHLERYIPEKYSPGFYEENILQDPFPINFNLPNNAFPYNGIVMPPQPEIKFDDYNALPYHGIAQSIADVGNMYNDIDNFVNNINTLPEIDPLLSDNDRRFLVGELTQANYQINYISAVQFIDAQIGRVMDALNAYPDLKQNTVIIILSDNGYSLGEKKHWTKWTLWETDIRVPLIAVVPGKNGNQIVNKTVSLLDLFPSVCELANVNIPNFSNGSKYIDGKSLIPLIDQPELIYEYPALTSIHKKVGIGSCFPHYSIRNEQFHYIRYQNNNDGSFPNSYCDNTSNSFEEELYEIGSNREIDPYEWNNLITNPDYKPVIQFLSQWMPDSALYLQKTNKAIIINHAVECLTDRNDTLFLSINLFDTTGILMEAPEDFIYKWSTNLTDSVFFGTEVEIPMLLIEEENFNANTKILVYFEMKDLEQTITVAFDLKTIYLNSGNLPVSDFSIWHEEGLTVCVRDYTITGSHTNSWWDFGEGQIVDDEIPGPYTYAEPGTYTITQYIEYGNDSCLTLSQRDIILENGILSPELNVKIFPNPASQFLHIELKDPLQYVALRICDITGRSVYARRFLNDNCIFESSVDVSGLDPGVYFLILDSADNVYKEPFVVAH
jgi:arylsulfatase A-like enzyme